MAVKTNTRPLVRTVSALDSFVTAAVTGPRFPDPQDWMCPVMGLPRDVLAKGALRIGGRLRSRRCGPKHFGRSRR